MSEKRVERLKLIFDSNVITGVDIFKLVLGVLRKMGLSERFSVKGASVAVRELETIISRKKIWPSRVESNGMELTFGMLPARSICFLEVAARSFCAETDMQEFAGVLVFNDGFVQAWIYDVEYDYWQNAKDPMEYERLGRSYVDLPKKSNGLPAPLEQLEIDTSDNPGRVELRSGYVEAIGRVMWLGELFWSRVGVKREISCDLLKRQGFDVTDTRGVVKVVAGCEFNDISTQDSQIIFRRILFGV
ncbi:hypothetical protein LP085_31125 [Achromobacter sp. MY14]|uniref:hypothetical protein n=1 Tax=unclassified Achromobacter TaxID=2626865 RepID=UPI001E552165|nr:hypothetical protein [Achromobacter sp. MY14]MCD0501333.1 hypothetical protein [Achromobacter sp. MY14]